MSVVANVAINLDARAAFGGLNQLGNAVQGLGGKVSALGQRMSGLAGIAASLGAGAAVSGFIKAGVEAQRTAKTIEALAGQYGEVDRLTKFANSSANEFGIGQTRAASAVADLYGRLRPMGISLQDIQTTFTGVNKAAALMNLSAADTEGVMLQLSQAMGSGALQGDELRSIMERMPAIGQAIATTMGVTVGQIKKLGADGKITTDIIIKALNDLAGVKAPPPDSFKLFQKTLEDVNTTIGTKLLPVFTPLLQKFQELIQRIVELGAADRIVAALAPLADVLLRLVTIFLELPPGVQETAIQFAAIAGAAALVIAPLGAVVGAMGTLISAVGTVVSVLGGLSIFATIAGWLGAVVPAIGAVLAGLQALGGVLVAVFSGPVGWVALVVAAGVAIYTFRDQIASAFGAIVQTITGAATSFYETFVKPVIDWARQSYEGIISAFRSLADALKSPFVAVANMIKGVLNQILAGIARAINGAIGAINGLIRGANRALAVLKLPAIPLVSEISVPQFAQGGVVSKPTLAMIGEGGEREFVVPESKASNFANSWLNNTKGGSSSSSPPVINLQTGPVLQQDDGKKYVSLSDLEKILQDFAAVVFNNARTAGGRRFQGVA